MLDMYNLLDEEGKRGVGIFVKAIQPHKATGQTASSAYYSIKGTNTKTTLEIFSRAFTPVLETGSRRAKTQVPSKEMIAQLKPWAQARGIPDEAVYAIAKKLLRDGQKVNRNVYSEQMAEFSEEVADRALKEFAGYVVDGIVKQLT